MLGPSQILAAARRGGCVSLLLGAAAVLLAFVPGAAEALAYDRAAIAGGEVWRAVTCHVTHWSWDHLIWDVSALVVLGLVCEAYSRRAFVWSVVSSALVIPLALAALVPEVATYRGLSGIDSAVFVALAVMLLGERLRTRQFVEAAVYAAVLAAFAGKIGFEYVAGATLFVDSGASGFTPIPLAHVVGGLAGGLCGGYATLIARRENDSTGEDDVEHERRCGASAVSSAYTLPSGFTEAART